MNIGKTTTVKSSAYKAKDLLNELIEDLLEEINSSRKTISKIGDDQLKLLGQ
jgi:hypothetical protein